MLTVISFLLLLEQLEKSMPWVDLQANTDGLCHRPEDGAFKTSIKNFLDEWLGNGGWG